MRTDDLLAAARKLPQKERVRLARKLLDTVIEGDEQENVDAAWRTEINRRLREVRSGKAHLADTESVLRELEAELADDRRRARSRRPQRHAR